MRELHAWDGPLFSNEARDSSQGLDLLLLPDSQVLRADTSFGQNGRGFGEYDRGAPNCAAAQMHEMPIVCETVRAGILAHGRDDDSIAKGNLADFQRRK
jgi:hypothetical protein